MKSGFEVVRVDRLEYVIKGAASHGVHRKLNRIHSGDDEDREISVDRLDAADQFNAGHAGKHHIGQHQVDRLLAQQG